MKSPKRTTKSSSKDAAQLKKLLNKHVAAQDEKFRHRLAHQLRIEKPRFWWKERKLWQKISLILLAFLMFFVGTMYGIAEWYIYTNRNKPLVYGVTFVPGYAEYFDLNPQDTMQAMIDDLGVRHFRLVSYWSDIEKTPGTYDFSQLDWQFKKAEDAGAKVSLAIGLRQPRWPECHMPDWASTETKAQWYPQLKNFMAATISRYKNSPALDSYQLENEFFLTVFGECKDFDRQRLIDEFNYTKQLDPKHMVIISRSNNAIGLPVGQPTPDEFGVSVYKRVWDKTITKRYFEYPFPAWFYGFLAGAGKILTGKDMIIHELQAEAWLPDGYDMKTAPTSELYKSLSPERLQGRFEYAKGTGMREIYLWGAEWWYYMKVKRNEPALWNTAKSEIAKDPDPLLYK